VNGMQCWEGQQL